MDIFQPIIDFFNFLNSFITTIAEGISGIVSIFGSIFGLLNSILRILPSPLYPTLMAFLPSISMVLIYKLFRKG